MSGIRKPMDRGGATVMLLLCAILGLHQIAIKAAAPDMAPIYQIALRSGLSAILMASVLVIRREGFPLANGTLLPGIVLGVAFSAEFFLVAEGLRHTTASHMAVFLYTAPIYTALVLHHRFPSERMLRHQWIGVGLAFAGVVMGFSGPILRGGFQADMLWGDLLANLAGIAWASTTIIIRCTRLADAPASQTLLYQLIAAFVLLLGYAFLSGQAQASTFTPLAWGSVLFQGVVITFGTYLAWFSMLRRYHASQLSVFLFLTPLFGVSFGVIILKETIDGFFAFGSLLVLAGLTLVSRRLPVPRER